MSSSTAQIALLVLPAGALAQIALALVLPAGALFPGVPDVIGALLSSAAGHILRSRLRECGSVSVNTLCATSR